MSETRYTPEQMRARAVVVVDDPCTCSGDFMGVCSHCAETAAMLRQAATDKVSVVDPMPVLRQFVKTFPSQRHAAAKLGISQQYLTDILHGRRDFSDRILQAVGLQRVIIVTEAKP